MKTRQTILCGIFAVIFALAFITCDGNNPDGTDPGEGPDTGEGPGGGSDPASAMYVSYGDDGTKYELVITETVAGRIVTGQDDSGRDAYAPKRGDKYTLTITFVNGDKVTSSGTVSDTSSVTIILIHSSGETITVTLTADGMSIGSLSGGSGKIAVDDGEDVLNPDVLVDGVPYTLNDDGTGYIVNKGIVKDGVANIPAAFRGVPIVAIGQWAFLGTGITSVTIPASITTIVEYAFSGCYSLTSVTFASGSQLTTIGNSAFSSCNNLTSITIPASVITIGNEAFSNCTKLTGITFASGSLLQTIGDSAFRNCTGLTSVTIPDGVISIGQQAFFDCASLTSVTIPESVTSIGNSAFSGTNITSVIIPEGTTTILDNAYTDTGITSIIIPASVTSIGDRAFSSCYNLTSVTFASGSQLQTIGEWAFYRISITSISIPASVTTIGKLAFCESNNLTSVNFESGSRLQTIGDSAFEDCISLTSITIPESVNTTTIGNYAFEGCISLTSVTIPTSVTTIGNYAFSLLSHYDNLSLTSVTFAAGSRLRTIGDNAFRYCDSLASITIPASVTAIGEYAFFDCTSLTSVTIPAGVTSIGNGAFRGCSSLTGITVDNANINYASDGGILYNKAKTQIVFVPLGISGNVTIPAGVTSIGSYVFDNCRSLTGITIPASVTTIGYQAFYRTSLNNITFASGSQLQTIDSSAFNGCTGLTSITIPENVTSIASSAFSGCTNLRNIIIDTDKVTTTYNGSNWGTIFLADNLSVTFKKNVGNSAFYNCTRLTNVTIAEGVTSIGDSAFSGCTSLTSVTCLPTTPPTLVGSGFGNNANLVIKVPAASVDAYKAASVWSSYSSKISAL